MTNRDNALLLCEEYIHQVWCMNDLIDGGAFAVYGLERHREKLHTELCELLEINREKSKDILSYLDEKIGLDLSKQPNKYEMEQLSKKLLDLLLDEKEKGNL